ncbi:hypothetical protein BFL38_12370 [Brachyspira hampsonii]|uniref:Uncharacterized protein n=1 Tax=Brachyspira hampsonii TaxID=1287055 RepID=A0A1E5NHB6_9SPIR|nr:hypothetical protein [Brachyspira hampsonii]OEJ15534.1 hypothetical protein BFL38_12370 [Brachyspira hampsonii]
MHGYTSDNVYKTFPSVSTDPNASFQGRFGVSFQTVEFKDYIYLISLLEDFFEQNPSGCRDTSLGSFTVSKNVYYRIDKNKDTSIGANWEKLNTPLQSVHPPKRILNLQSIHRTQNRF